MVEGFLPSISGSSAGLVRTHQAPGTPQERMFSTVVQGRLACQLPGSNLLLHVCQIVVAMTDRPKDTSAFRMILVGAGVAGLTASHCFQKAGIDDVALELERHS